MTINPKIIQDLHDILKDESAGLVSKWRAGEFIDKFFRSLPAKGGELAALSAALPTSGPKSKESLHQCRTFYRGWEWSEVESAQRNGLSWNSMVQLLSIKPMLKRTKKAAKKKEFQSQLNDLIADRSSAREWTRKCKTFKLHLAGKCAEVSGVPFKKLISEQGRATVNRIGGAVESWEDMRSAIPKAFSDRHEAISSKLKQLKADIQLLNAEMLGKETLPPYEDF